MSESSDESVRLVEGEPCARVEPGGVYVVALSDSRTRPQTVLDAIEGFPRGSSLTVDLDGLGLHPEDVRDLFEEMREVAARRGLRIFVPTRQRGIVSCLRDDFDSILATAPGSDLLVPLTQIHHKGWLSHFDPGDLYGSAFSARSNPEEHDPYRDVD